MKTCEDFAGVPGKSSCCKSCHEHVSLCEVYASDGKLVARVCCDVHTWIGDTIAQHVIDSWGRE